MRESCETLQTTWMWRFCGMKSWCQKESSPKTCEAKCPSPREKWDGHTAALHCFGRLNGDQKSQGSGVTISSRGKHKRRSESQDWTWREADLIPMPIKLGSKPWHSWRADTTTYWDLTPTSWEEITRELDITSQRCASGQNIHKLSNSDIDTCQYLTSFFISTVLHHHKINHYNPINKHQ